MGNWDLASGVNKENKGTKSGEVDNSSASHNSGSSKLNNFDTVTSGLGVNFDESFSFGEQLPNGQIKTTTDAGGYDMNDVYKNALNGQYKYVLDNSKDVKKGFIKDQFKKIGMDAWGIANYVKESNKTFNENLTNGKWKSNKDAEDFYKNFQSELGDMKSKFQRQWFKTRASVDQNESGDLRANKPVYFSDNARLVTPTQYSKLNTNKQKSSRDKGSSRGTNMQVVEDRYLPNRTKEIGILSTFTGAYNALFGDDNDQEMYVIEDPEGAYNHVALNDRKDRSNWRNVINPIVSGWTTNGFAATGKGEYKERYETGVKVHSLVDDILAHVSKNGTGGEESNKWKHEATSMVYDMKDMPYKEKKAYIQKHNQTFQNISTKLGYYGSFEIYQKHKKTFQEPKYYNGKTSNEKQKSFSTSVNKVEKMLNQRIEYEFTKKAIEKQVWSRVPKELGFYHDKSGRQNGWSPRQSLDWDKDGEADNTFRMKGVDNNAYDSEKFIPYDKENDVIKSVKTRDADMNAMVYQNLLNGADRLRSQSEVLELIAKESGKKDNGNFNARYFDDTEVEYQMDARASAYYDNSGSTALKFNPGYSKAEMIKAYQRVKSTYKASFGKTDLTYISPYTSLINGISWGESDFIEYPYVDPKDDNTKTDDLNKIKEIVDNQPWTSGSVPNVFITDSDYNHNISQGNIDSKNETEEWTTEHQQKLYKNFFRNEDGNDVYKLEFSRESPLKNKAFYTFLKLNPDETVKKKNGKEQRISMYIDKGLASEYKETFVRDTYSSASEWSFSVDGQWDLKYMEGSGSQQKAKNLKIIYKDGYKYISGQFWDATLNDGEGGFAVQQELLLAKSEEISIENAEEIVLKYINSIQR